MITFDARCTLVADRRREFLSSAQASRLAALRAPKDERACALRSTAPAQTPTSSSRAAMAPAA
jgi:hypothetical protein